MTHEGGAAPGHGTTNVSRVRAVNEATLQHTRNKSSGALHLITNIMHASDSHIWFNYGKVPILWKLYKRYNVAIETKPCPDDSQNKYLSMVKTMFAI